MAQERPHQAEVSLDGPLSHQEGPYPENGFQHLQRVAVERFDHGRRLACYPVLPEVLAALAREDQAAAHAERERNIAQHRAGDLRTHQCAVFNEGPAIIQRRAPQPLIEQIFQQQAEEAGQRILRRQNGARESCFKLRDDRRCVGEPSAIRRLYLRHLGNAGFAGAAAEVGRVHAHKFKRDSLDPEVGFKLARKV